MTYIPWSKQAEDAIKSGRIGELCKFPTTRHLLRDTVEDAARMRHARECADAGPMGAVQSLEVHAGDVEDVARMLRLA